MRDDTRKKLDARLSAERRAFALGWAVLALIAGGAALLAGPKSAPTPKVPATVRSSLIHADPDHPRLIIEIRVELPDGRIAVAASRTGITPMPGERIVLADHVSWGVFHSYYWDGEKLPPVATP